MGATHTPSPERAHAGTSWASRLRPHGGRDTPKPTSCLLAYALWVDLTAARPHGTFRAGCAPPPPGGHRARKGPAGARRWHFLRSQGLPTSLKGLRPPRGCVKKAQSTREIPYKCQRPIPGSISRDPRGHPPKIGRGRHPLVWGPYAPLGPMGPVGPPS